MIVLRNETNQGIGAAMKKVFAYSLDRGYDVLVIHAGNDKDDPLEIPKLLARSREAARLRAGFPVPRRGPVGNMPGYRVIGTRVIHLGAVAGRRENA